MQVQIRPLGDRDILIGYQQWQGKVQGVIRYLYEDKQTGQKLPGKNGINIPEEDVLDAIELLLNAYNEHVGTKLVIMDSGE
jgi:hypothetical protein